VSASSERAESPSTGVISSWDISLVRRGLPISTRQTDLSEDSVGLDSVATTAS
jgi:hypothetical protein